MVCISVGSLQMLTIYVCTTTIQRFPKHVHECVKPSEEGKSQLHMTVLPMVPHLEVLRTHLSLWTSHTLLFIQIEHLCSLPRDILLRLLFLW